MEKEIMINAYRVSALTKKKGIDILYTPFLILLGAKPPVFNAVKLLFR